MNQLYNSFITKSLNKKYQIKSLTVISILVQKQFFIDALEETRNVILQMCKAEKIDQAFFPVDFTKFNGKCQYLSRLNYNNYLVLMCFFMTGLFAALLLYGPEIDNFVFLTYWGFTATLFYFYVALIQNTMQRVFRDKIKLKTWKVVHYIFADVMCLELFINGIYWLVFFPWIVTHRKPDDPVHVLDVIQAVGAHLTPLLLLTLQLFNNLVCFWNLSRVVPTVLLLLAYLLVNVVYTLEVGIIYEVLDYVNWLTYVFIVAAALGILVCYFILRMFSKYWKEKRIRKLIGMEETISPQGDSSSAEMELVLANSIKAPIEIVEQSSNQPNSNTI